MSHASKWLPRKKLTLGSKTWPIPCGLRGRSLKLSALQAHPFQMRKGDRSSGNDMIAIFASGSFISLRVYSTQKLFFEATSLSSFQSEVGFPPNLFSLIRACAELHIHFLELARYSARKGLNSPFLTLRFKGGFRVCSTTTFNKHKSFLVRNFSDRCILHAASRILQTRRLRLCISMFYPRSFVVQAVVHHPILPFIHCNQGVSDSKPGL